MNINFLAYVGMYIVVSVDIGRAQEPNILSRVDRVYNSTEIPQMGQLPSEYFDAPKEIINKPNDILNPYTYQYQPFITTDDELLAEPRIKVSPYVRKPNEITVYCYPFGNEEVLSKCSQAIPEFDATGLYLPLMAEIGAERERIYYEQLRKLKADRPQAKIYGVAYDNPNWNLISQIVLHYPHLFDGILIEWIGRNACIWNIRKPSTTQIQNILNMAGPIYYFFRNQECPHDLLLEQKYGAAFINPNDGTDVNDVTITPGRFPKFLTPIFPCFQGQEGGCYTALRNFKDLACSSRQKYVFSPYEPIGNLIMHFTNETCQGLPDHDLYSVI